MKKRRLTIQLGEGAYRLLRALYETEMYGRSLAEAAEFILMEELRNRYDEPKNAQDFDAWATNYLSREEKPPKR